MARKAKILKFRYIPLEEDVASAALTHDSFPADDILITLQQFFHEHFYSHRANSFFGRSLLSMAVRRYQQLPVEQESQIKEIILDE